jgi:hypothetical protein
MADDRKLEEDQLVSRLVPDPTQGPPNTTPLRGYLGRSPAPTGKGKEPVWRLYSGPALDEYVEIPESEILHSQKLPEEQGTIVWVSKTLPLSYVRVHSAQVQAELLGSGPIAQTQAVGASPAHNIAGGGLDPSVATVCTQITCPPPSGIPSHCFLCPPITAQSQCGGVCPPPHSHVHLCITETMMVSRCGGVCEPRGMAFASELRLCPTPTATISAWPCRTTTIAPSHFRLCPSHLTPCHTAPFSHLPECPVEGPVKVEPEQ